MAAVVDERRAVVRLVCAAWSAPEVPWHRVDEIVWGGAVSTRQRALHQRWLRRCGDALTGGYYWPVTPCSPWVKAVAGMAGGATEALALQVRSACVLAGMPWWRVLVGGGEGFVVPDARLSRSSFDSHRFENRPFPRVDDSHWTSRRRDCSSTRLVVIKAWFTAVRRLRSKRASAHCTRASRRS